jgi:hypothetical protein
MGVRSGFLLLALTFFAAGHWRMAIAKPEITIAHVEELFADEVRSALEPGDCFDQLAAGCWPTLALH